jgi:hypothetical protein
MLTAALVGAVIYDYSKMNTARMDTVLAGGMVSDNQKQRHTAVLSVYLSVNQLPWNIQLSMDAQVASHRQAALQIDLALPCLYDHVCACTQHICNYLLLDILYSD